MKRIRQKLSEIQELATPSITEITIKRHCPHQNRDIVVSTNPLRNECERCYQHYVEENDKQRLA